MSRKDILYLLGLVLYLNLFFFHSLGSVAFNLILWSIFIFFLSLVRQKNKTTVLLTTIGLILVSIITISRANIFISLLLFLSGLGLVGFTITILKDKIPFVRSLFELLILPVNFAFSYLEGGLDFLLTRKSNKNIFRKFNLFSIIIGLVIGVPIIAVLLSLFSSADPVFSTYLSKLFIDLSWQRLGDRLILSAISGLLFSPFIYFFTKKKSFTLPKQVSRVSFTAEASIVMFLISITLFSFIIVQWPYIFAKVAYETDLSKFGVATYSEYVKKGFTELLLVSLIVYSVIWFSFLALRGKGLNKRSLLFYLQIVVFSEFFLILFSIFRRVYLYQAYHGWSLVRIYGGFFLVWILMIAATLFARHFIKAKWVMFEVVGTGLIILLLGFFNAEDFIVKNHPPTVNKWIDYIYLSKMSPDGYEGWKSAYNFAQKTLANDKEFLNREERREIAYAGIVINMLSYKYHRLLTHYGSQIEQQEYYNLILNNNPYSQDFCFNSSNNMPPDQEIYMPVWYPYYFKFDMSNCASVSFYNFYSKNKNKYTNFDKFLSWNYTEDKVYNRMKNEMSIKNLLELQNRFYVLFQKIANQKEDERNFDYDVSFQTPFL